MTSNRGSNTGCNINTNVNSMNVEIPAGLTDLLQNFTVSVLKERPNDLVAFASDYFCNMRDHRAISRSFGGTRRGVSFTQDDEPMQTDSDDEALEEPPRGTNYARRKSVAAERYDPEADDEEMERVCHPKSDEQRLRLSEAVKNILIFRSLDVEQMQDVLDAMFERKVEPKDHVIEQGDDGDNFYVIDSGKYDIYVKIDGKDKCVGSYDNTGSFGELALLYNMPRAATIKATTQGSLWAMDRTTFRRIVLKNAFKKRKMYENLIEKVPILKSLTPFERMNVADALVTKVFHDGEVIIKQGDSADYMYFIEDGEVQIRAKKEGIEKNVKRIHRGGYFGELALLTKNQRAASAHAVGNVKCAVLDVHAFERLLGPCMDIMKRNINEYQGQLDEVFKDQPMKDLR